MSDKVYTAEAEAEYAAFAREYEDHGCTCFISPPCGWCAHPGNPRNLNENEDNFKPSTEWTMPVDSDVLIARDVGHARRVLATFIDELYCRHVREMRGKKLPPGIFGFDVKDEQEFAEYYRLGERVGLRLPTVRKTMLEMRCTYERAVEYMIAPGEVVSLDFMGVPGKWYAAVEAANYQIGQERQCVVYFRKVAS